MPAQFTVGSSEYDSEEAKQPTAGRIAPTMAGQRPGKETNAGLATDVDGYSLRRYKAHERASAGWIVIVRRCGRAIVRNFKDVIYGSSEAALNEACAYRDAVIAALPPLTNREKNTRLRRNNRSGIAGVRRQEGRSGPFWVASIETKNEGARHRSFAVNKYGEAEAKALATAQRQEWLAEMPAAFVMNNHYGEVDAYQHFANRLEFVPDVLPTETLSKEIVDAQLAEINARFDARRPPRLRVRVKQYAANQLDIVVSDIARPRRRKRTGFIRYRDRPLADVLAEAGEKVEAIVADLFNIEAARWFMDTHGNALLDPKTFDPEVGFSVFVFVPRALVDVDDIFSAP